jgi:hypothetical protein
MNRSNTLTGFDFDESLLATPFESFDAEEQLALADRADWMLLRLVLCAATATLLLALASSLGR